MVVLAPIQETLLEMLGRPHLSKGGTEPASKTCPGGGAVDQNPSFHLKVWLWVLGMLFGVKGGPVNLGLSFLQSWRWCRGHSQGCLGTLQAPLL